MTATSRKASTSSLMPLDDGNVEPRMQQPEAEKQERQHLLQIISAFHHYHVYSHARVQQSECYLNTLPQRHQQMLVKYRTHLSVIRDCIDKNQQIIEKMLRVELPFANENELGAGNGFHGTRYCESEATAAIRYTGQEGAQTTLKLIARDWSTTGAQERAQSYKPIIDAIEQYYKPEDYETNEIKILVPGAGLGRLLYELACRGYECEGNEISYFMVIASNFLLNHCSEANKYTLFPWIHQYVNNLRMSDQVSSIKFPDVCPKKNLPKGNITFAAGDFLEVYTAPNAYDCVATSFFIDCGKNVVDFIETIYKILVPGGIWVNLGPLLYHSSDVQNEESIEPTFENLLLIIELVGFEILRSETGLRTKYAQNPHSMMKNEYESLFWICRRPKESVSNEGNTNNILESENLKLTCTADYLSVPNSILVDSNGGGDDYGNHFP